VRVACVAVVALGCSGHEFICQSSDQCVDGALQGTCESSAYCSFPDSSCSSQRRYGELAAAELAGECVDAANLIANGTCDVDTASWRPFQGTVSLSTTARTGAHSCMVCGAGLADFTMDDIEPTVASAAPGESFLGQAWVRTAPGAAIPTQTYLEIRDATTESAEASNFVAVDATWQQVTLVHAVATTTQPVELFIAGKTSAPSTNPCFLVDDITLVRVH
jgi:hypothetical protein